MSSLYCFICFCACVSIGAVPNVSTPQAQGQRSSNAMSVLREVEKVCLSAEEEYDICFDYYLGYISLPGDGVSAESISMEGTLSPDGVDLIRTYDIYGRFIESKRWDIFGQFGGSVLFERDVFGRVCRVKRRYFEDGIPDSVVLYGYDQESRLKSKERYDRSGLLISKIELDYDLLGRLWKVRCALESGGVGSNRFEYVYGFRASPDVLWGLTDGDKRERLIEVSYRDLGRIRDTAIMYGEKLSLVLCETLDENEKVLRSHQFSFGGEMISIEINNYFLGSGAKRGRETFEFGGDGGTRVWGDSIFWDAEGRLKGLEELNQVNSRFVESSFSYVNDSKGNWVERVRRIHGHAGAAADEVEVVKRDLSYFHN